MRRSVVKPLHNRGQPASGSPRTATPPRRGRFPGTFHGLGLGLSAALMLAALAPAAGADEGPGRLVRLPDGRHLNFHCSGRGAPLVLLESGYGAGFGAWAPVQPIIAQQTRVCSYDRAGYGLSDKGPLPRDGEAIARDLDAALQAMGERGPFVIAGHSAGGLYARLFAARRHRQVVGMVLVDPTIEHQEARFAALFGPGAGSLAPIREGVLNCLKPPPDGAARGLGRPGCAGQGRTLLETELSELDNLSGRTSDQIDRHAEVVRNIPVVVLTAVGQASPQDPGLLAWIRFHRELAGRFTQGVEREVKSSHLMIGDRPDVVSAEILRLTTAARSR